MGEKEPVNKTSPVDILYKLRTINFFSRSPKHRMKHRAGQFTGKCVLLAGVIGTQECHSPG